jgi:hypothetical protein
MTFVAVDRRSSDFVAADGAVMTDEVGVVTGDLTLVTEVDAGGAVAQRVRYQQALEWYTVTGAPTALADGQDIDAVHTEALARVRRPDG